MTSIIVASTNPVKIEAARLGFERVFPADTLTASGINVPSGISDQPMSDEETLQGALNRATNARAAAPESDFWIGIEGGVEEKHGAMFAYAWIAVCSPEQTGLGRTGALLLPRELADLVRQGVELGIADDRVFGRSNSKQQNGAVGILTHDLIDRVAYYEHAMILALIPFVNPSLNFEIG